jgi:hypothetical protein
MHIYGTILRLGPRVRCTKFHRTLCFKVISILFNVITLLPLKIQYRYRNDPVARNLFVKARLALRTSYSGRNIYSKNQVWNSGTSRHATCKKRDSRWVSLWTTFQWKYLNFTSSFNAYTCVLVSHSFTWRTVTDRSCIFPAIFKISVIVLV